MMHRSVLELTRHFPRFSLQKMSLIRIMTILCNNPELLDLILKCNFQKDLPFRFCAKKGIEWKAVEAMANEMVSQICNSVLLKKSILEFLWPTSYRIMLWKSIYAPSISNALLEHFYWTERGRINNSRTARYIVRNKCISVRRRFVLACSVCLSTEIHEMWREMSNEDKAYFYAENREKIRPLLLFWAHALKGSENIEDYMYNALACALEYGLLEAVKYLVTISTKEVNEYMAELCMSHLFLRLGKRRFLEEDQNDIGYFVFFEMSDQSQKGFFNIHTATVLSLLLHSSEYTLCFNLLAERLQSASERDISVILDVIFHTYHTEDVNDDDCRKLFIDVWRMIPTSIRSSITQTHLGAEYLSLLIRDNFPFLLEKEAFKKVTKLTSLDLESSTPVKQFDFHQGKWKLLHFLIEEEVTTIPLLKIYRKEILYFLERRESDKKAWNGILRFVRKVLSKNSQHKA